MSGREFSLNEVALEGVSTPILIHDHHHVLFANRAAVELLGARQRNEVVGQLLGRFVHPDGVQAGEARRKLVMEDGHSVTDIPVKLVGVDGVVRYATASALPIVYDDGTKAILVSAVLTRTGTPTD